MSDTGSYYSINPHMTDVKNGTTRRLVFGWITGGVSPAVAKQTVRDHAPTLRDKGREGKGGKGGKGEGREGRSRE